MILPLAASPRRVLSKIVPPGWRGDAGRSLGMPAHSVQQSFFGAPSGPPRAGGLACSSPLRAYVLLPDVADISHFTASGFGLGHRQDRDVNPDL